MAYGSTARLNKDFKVLTKLQAITMMTSDSVQPLSQ